MGSYSLSEEAVTDLIRIHSWGVRNHGEAQADEYYYQFIKRFEQLAERPLSYPLVDDIRPGYRRSVCGIESIYYRVKGNTVEIMAILRHQDLDFWL